MHSFVENTDQTETGREGGPYFIAKVNNDGVYVWIQTSDRTYYGSGYSELII